MGTWRGTGPWAEPAAGVDDEDEVTYHSDVAKQHACRCKKAEEDDGTLRTFATGATRDTGEGKPQHWAFGSALVEKRFGEYMHSKRIQTDGKLRAVDNWKKGIPQWEYFHSLSRHTNDMRLISEGFRDEATEPDMEVVLCAMLFNVQGLLHEVLKENMVNGNPANREHK